MIDKERLVKEFIELVQIDSLSFQERQMADTLKLKLENMGLAVYEDDAGEKLGGSAGNIICTVKGEKKDAPAILLMAHMDTVVPGKSKKAVLHENIIRTDGTTVLGGDDAAGIECILEAVRVLKEDKIKHGDMQIVFTIAEEGGIFGAKNLNYGKIFAKYGFVMDSGGKIGNVDIKAPSQNTIDVIIRGKAAHAGLEPEKGVSAIQIAAEAISHMRLGRIDDETTANIGIINGGQVTNIVCDMVHIKAEARSRDENKLDMQTYHMEECIKKAASDFGGSVEFNYERLYPAFSIKENDCIMTILKKAAKESGIGLMLEATGGGSDTNIINGKGIQAVNVSVGMEKVHSVEEQICIDDMVRAVEFLIAIIKAV